VKRTIEEAVKEAENIGAATGSDIQTLITGSFYLVGGALHILQPDTD
jgi:folylpolyglutamate synthase/dihydropteroate synthase